MRVAHRRPPPKPRPDGDSAEIPACFLTRASGASGRPSTKDDYPEAWQAPPPLQYTFLGDNSPTPLAIALSGLPLRACCREEYDGMGDAAVALMQGPTIDRLSYRPTCKK